MKNPVQFLIPPEHRAAVEHMAGAASRPGNQWDTWPKLIYCVGTPRFIAAPMRDYAGSVRQARITLAFVEVFAAGDSLDG
jgi:hypothetical protein